MEGDKDAVSIMQESVDQLALSMFDSLRLIPFSEEVKGGARGVSSQHQSQQPQQQLQQQPVLRRAVKTNAAWASQVQSLAEGVLKKANELDGLIDVLPGAELREDQQMEAKQEIARLDKEGREKRAELAKMVEKAEGLSRGVNGTLDQLADHMLGAPR
ncbi:unnamed protein product [Hapterophycus canaliculatus]